MKNINLIFDLVIYCLFYVCFSQFIVPVITFIITYLGARIPDYSYFFWDIDAFFVAYFYFPLMVFLAIIAWIEFYTNIFDSWIVQFVLKFVCAIFFMSIMVAISMGVAQQ